MKFFVSRFWRKVSSFSVLQCGPVLSPECFFYPRPSTHPFNVMFQNRSRFCCFENVSSRFPQLLPHPLAMFFFNVRDHSLLSVLFTRPERSLNSFLLS